MENAITNNGKTEELFTLFSENQEDVLTKMEISDYLMNILPINLYM